MQNLNEETIKNIEKILQENKSKSEFAVNYVGTNADIDFSSSFEAKCHIFNNNAPTILSCNFSGTDLKGSGICMGQRVVNCSLENASIELVIEALLKAVLFVAVILVVTQ